MFDFSSYFYLKAKYRSEVINRQFDLNYKLTIRMAKLCNSYVLQLLIFKDIHLILKKLIL